MANQEAEPPELEDFGFFDSDYRHVLETGQIFVNHHVLPHAGGWDDQPLEWRADMMTFLSLLARKRWEYWDAQRRSRGNSGGGDGETSSVPLPPLELRNWKQSLVQHHG